MTQQAASQYIIRNIDGLRVTLAGFPPHMSVAIGEGCEIEAGTIAELRAIAELPHSLEVLIPYRLSPEAVVSVNRLPPEWDQDER